MIDNPINNINNSFKKLYKEIICALNETPLKNFVNKPRWYYYPRFWRFLEEGEKIESWDEFFLPNSLQTRWCRFHESNFSLSYSNKSLYIARRQCTFVELIQVKYYNKIKNVCSKRLK